MRTHRIMPALLTLMLAAAPAQAADLTKIDRAIAKEPAYQSKQPKYCLLVFGSEAKFRVWLVRDGNVLYVDRNGNGDLTEEGERVRGTSGIGYFRAGDLSEADGKTKHRDLSVVFYDSWSAVRVRHAELDSEGKPVWQQASRYSVGHKDVEDLLQFAEKPQEAPIIHFSAPLSMRVEEPVVLVRGNNFPSKLSVRIGTPGLGEGTFAHFSYMGTWDGRKALATIEFPSVKGSPKQFTVELLYNF